MIQNKNKRELSRIFTLDFCEFRVKRYCRKKLFCLGNLVFIIPSYHWTSEIETRQELFFVIQFLFQIIQV